MSDIRAPGKTIQNIATILALLLTVASGSWALSVSQVVRKQEALELRVQKQEIVSGITEANYRSIKEQMDRIERKLDQHIEK
jgi:hypothetical protein